MKLIDIKKYVYNKRNNNYYNCLSLPVKNCYNSVLLYLFVMKTRGLFYPNEEQTINTIYSLLLKTIISVILFYMPVTNVLRHFTSTHTISHGIKYVHSCYCIVSCNSFFFFCQIVIFFLTGHSLANLKIDTHWFNFITEIKLQKF